MQGGDVGPCDPIQRAVAPAVVGARYISQLCGSGLRSRSAVTGVYSEPIGGLVPAAVRANPAMTDSAAIWRGAGTLLTKPLVCIHHDSTGWRRWNRRHCRHGPGVDLRVSGRAVWRTGLARSACRVTGKCPERDSLQQLHASDGDSDIHE